LLFRCFVGQIAAKFGALSVNMTENSVVPFAPSDGLDKAGESILKLLHKAAGVAEQNSQHALDMAQVSPAARGRAAHH
jgi:hypothetical protein